MDGRIANPPELVVTGNKTKGEKQLLWHFVEKSYICAVKKLKESTKT